MPVSRYDSAQRTGDCNCAGWSKHEAGWAMLAFARRLALLQIRSCLRRAELLA